MVKQIEWTPDMLEGVRIALATTLGKVTREAVAPTAVIENWDKVQKWLGEVSTIDLGEEVGEAASPEVPPFPLTGNELRALQISVDRIALAQAAASPSMEAPAPRRLFESLMRLRVSSYILIGVILCSLIASTINYLVFQDPFERFFLLVSVALTLLGTIVTRRHFFGLHSHEALLQNFDPSLYLRQ
jgi:hypothetical protein